MPPPGSADAERFLGDDPELQIDREVLHEIAVNGRAPLALAGRVPCKVSAANGPIQAGDLLTVANLPGHAMRRSGQGPVLGTALQSWSAGEGRIVVLIQPGGNAVEPERYSEGRARLVGGAARVEFPAIFAADVADPRQVRVHLTAVGRPLQLYVASVDAAGFEVRGAADGEFFWSVR